MCSPFSEGFCVLSFPKYPFGLWMLNGTENLIFDTWYNNPLKNEGSCGNGSYIMTTLRWKLYFPFTNTVFTRFTYWLNLCFISKSMFEILSLHFHRNEQNTENPTVLMCVFPSEAEWEAHLSSWFSSHSVNICHFGSLLGITFLTLLGCLFGDCSAQNNLHA